MKVRVLVMNAFSVNNHGGNPAGVVLDADQFTNGEKQRIATEAGFAETAFISQSRTADFKLDFFTTTKQIPHCGHATIATFTYLKAHGRISGDRSSKETIDGNRSIFFNDGLAYMEQTAPVFTPLVQEVEEIAESLNITRADLAPGHIPTIVNTGNSFLMIKLKDENVLAAIEYDRPKVKSISHRHGLIGFYPFFTTVANDIDATTRMFGPDYGIDEEAATGMAAGPLASYLFKIEGKHKTHFNIEQGKFMSRPSPSLIHVDLELEGERIVRLFAGGAAYVSGEKWVELNL